MLHRRGVLGAVVGAAAVAAGVGTALAQAPLKVGFVYVGPIGDHGWSYQHHQGLLAVKKEFGDKVETTFVENVPEGPDAERVIDQLASQGHKLIFTTSFGFMNPTIKVAAKYPDIKFEHMTGFKQTDNVATANIRFYEGRYIAGILAAKASKTGTIGYIGSFPIPEVVMGINATYLGAKTVNPNIKMKIIWVSTWFDPGKESDAAKALADQGVDIIMQHTDSPAPVKFAEERKIFAIGQASDMKAFGPNSILTSLVDDWSGYYIGRVKALLGGTWKSGDVWGGLNTGMLALPAYGPGVSADAKALADGIKAKIISGEFHPFTGPMKKQDGTEFLKTGEKMADKDLAGMNFYVEGVEGVLPK
jgi:basic membrane protein A and related proteins